MKTVLRPPPKASKRIETADIQYIVEGNDLTANRGRVTTVLLECKLP